MDLKKGLKQTEIGLIPEDWDTCPFSEVADKSVKWSITGGPFGSNLKATDYTDDGVQIIQLQNIGDGVFYDDYTIYTSVEKADELISCNIYPGEIILSKMGDPVARACFIPNKAGRFLMASDGIRLVVNEREFSKRFVHDYINSVYFRRRAFEVSNGSTRLRIGLPELKKLLLIKPPKAEQTAIAAALSDMDNLIAGLEQLIAKKKAIKQGAMQELLRPKEGWEVKKLKDLIIEFQNGFAFSAIGYETSGVPIVTMAQIGLDGSFNFDESKVNFWRIEEFNMLRNYHLVNGDLIIAMTDVTPEKNLIGRMAIVKSKETLLLNQRVGLLRLDETKVNPYILKTYSNMRSWRNYCIGAASLGVQANIGTRDILNGEIILPNIDIQNEIAEVLIDMDNELQLLEKNLEKYKLLKQGMMQELLTGKTRLV